ncbi:MAG: 50S ribosomal protein L4 [Candidatus Margulisbacteria bacterium]|nr:50S ribosomal protein L4 [Candidatus Margulisiibacteriota bacterium]
MIDLPLCDLSGKSAGKVSASNEVFGQKLNEPVVQTALVWYLASTRRGTHGSKTKAEVSGGGKKPWKQKGTGRARAGSNRSPLWRKGGVVFGPKPRDYGFALPKKARKLALKVALSDKAKEGKVKVVDEFKLSGPKTKLAVKLLLDLGVSGKILLVMDKDNEQFERAARNIRGVKITRSRELNIFDLLNAEWLLAEKKAIASLEEALA